MTRVLALIASFMICGRVLAGDSATSLDASQWAVLEQADVVILGEVHDNPHHHAMQAAIVARLDPAALVFEMLTQEQVAAITPENRADEDRLRDALEWEGSGWPDFSMYYPIFAESGEARIFAALLPRDKARDAMEKGMAAAFGPDAGLFGLTEPLDPTQQTRREVMQMAAHCDALPQEMLPTMVEIQRLRDAVLARAVLDARQGTDGQVVVITGNGHARADWGVPVYLDAARPDLRVVTIGQGEDGGAPPGAFDIVLDAPAPERGDPCDAFR